MGKVVRSKISGKNLVQNTALIIGNFDGVHLGHVFVLKLFVKEAIKRGLEPWILSFYPHPISVIKRIKLNGQITPLTQKSLYVENIGIKGIIGYRFTKQLSLMLPEDFVQKVLIDQLNVKFLFLGLDTALGKNREGDTETLSKILSLKGIDYSVASGFFNLNGIKIGSRIIREEIKEGRVDQVRKFLGRYYSIIGRVFRGDGRGKKLGFATANIRINGYIPPKYGVYLSQVELDGATYNAISNIGIKPTFANSGPACETFLLDYNGVDFYRKKIRVNLLRFIREERRFENLEELKLQIINDIKDARDMHQNGNF